MNRAEPHNPFFSLLVKPTSAECNFACDYCFYLGKAELYTGTRSMNDEVLESMIRSYFATEQPVYGFCWQGGEPALMGRGFFERVTTLQEKFAPPGSVVSNSIQTNGSLITPELARHLKKYRFLAGVSVDGSEEFHDRYRKTRGGQGTYKQVIRGLENLLSAGVETNALVLVSSANAGNPGEVFRHLVSDLAFRYLQFIPCVETDGAGAPLPWSISGESWGAFLCALFDEWQSKWTRKVSIRNFDALLHLLVGGHVVSCNHGRECGGYFVVEHNGDVYPCDFFVDPELKLGNCTRDSWSSMSSSARYKEFQRRKNPVGGECARCAYLRFCRGDCVKFRRPENGYRTSTLCPGWKMFYHHALPAFMHLAERIGRRF